MRRTLTRFLFLAALLPLARPAFAEEFVIIVNPANDGAVDRELVAKIYKGNAASWPGGGKVAAFALPDENALRVAFDKEVLAKTPAQTRARWSELTFSGTALPPKVVDSEADVVKAVAENKGAIGYVSAKAAGAGVKVIH